MGTASGPLAIGRQSDSVRLHNTTAATPGRESAGEPIAYGIIVAADYECFMNIP
jgi:hypothetical protein